jgi:excisionase family DNA binding protein
VINRRHAATIASQGHARRGVTMSYEKGVSVTESELLQHDDESQAVAYTVDDVARKLTCSQSTIYRLIRRGRLKAFRINDRLTRISAASLASFIEGESS